jgi:hypothetical protein
MQPDSYGIFCIVYSDVRHGLIVVEVTFLLFTHAPNYALEHCQTFGNADNFVVSEYL